MAFKIMTFITLLPLLFIGLCNAYQIHVKNNCNYNVWPGLAEHNFANIPNFAKASAPNRGALVKPGQTWTANVPDNWIGGRVWGRTGCNKDATKCKTGTCPGGMQCTDYNWTDSLTVAEFGWGRPTAKSPNRVFYNLSVIQGFNVGVSVKEPSGKPKTAKSLYPANDQAWTVADKDKPHSPSVQNCRVGNAFTITFCP